MHYSLTPTRAKRVKQYNRGKGGVKRRLASRNDVVLLDGKSKNDVVLWPAKSGATQF